MDEKNALKKKDQAISIAVVISMLILAIWTTFSYQRARLDLLLVREEIINIKQNAINIRKEAVDNDAKIMLLLLDEKAQLAKHEADDNSEGAMEAYYQLERKVTKIENELIKK